MKLSLGRQLQKSRSTKILNFCRVCIIVILIGFLRTGVYEYITMEKSSDVEIVETDTSKETDQLEKNEERPIMLLFKQLISNDDTETTVLTNAQIFEILNKEFDINVSVMHKLEIDIYLNVMKKFLKEWPKWGQFDRVVHRLKAPEFRKLLHSTLEDKYKLLKHYLNKQLTLTKPYAKEAVKELSQMTSSNTKENDTKDVIMELFCSREQLNQLFYRHPKGDLSTNIFNVTNTFQNKIILNKWDIESVLNMWNVRVNINLNTLIYKRETVHKLNHVLVNKKHGSSQQTTKLDTRLQEKSNKGKDLDKDTILTSLSDILKICKNNNIKIYNVLYHIFSIIEKDLNNAPDSLRMPAKYRQYLNEYPYVRYLCANEDDQNSSDVDEKYDLQLQETVCPMIEYSIGKVDSQEKTLPPFHEWFKIECGMCKVKFMGDDLIKQLEDHFSDHHHNEPDWQCTNCDSKFDMKQITEVRWSHECS